MKESSLLGFKVMSGYEASDASLHDFQTLVRDGLVLLRTKEAAQL